MNLKEAAEMALEALEGINKLSVGEKAICLPAEIDDAMEALRQALAPPKQEPVAWVGKGKCQKLQEGAFVTATLTSHRAVLHDVPLYTAPPQKEWVGLTDEEILDCWKQAYEPGHREHMNAMNMARTVEAKLKEKNAND